MKTICIGDSIVNGYPFERSYCWVSLLAEKEKRLAEKAELQGEGSQELSQEFVNKGIDGQTSEEVLWRFTRDTAGFDRILLSVGANDFIFTGAEPEGVVQNIKSMFIMSQRAGARAETEAEAEAVQGAASPLDGRADKRPQFVVMTPILAIPQMAAQFWMNGADYNRVNEKLRRERELLLLLCRELSDADNAPADEKRISCIDVQEAYESWCKEVGTEAAYVDGIHPTKEGYREIAEIIKQALMCPSGHVYP